jgi:hypothetical protein
MSKLIMLIAPLAVALAVALTMAPALAHGHHDGDACRQDLQTLCPGVTPGPGSFYDCLATLCPDRTPGPGAFASCLEDAAKAQTVTLSDQCQAHLTKMQAKSAAWQQACGGDAQTFCGDVAPGHWATGKCLREHQSELSQPCQDLLAQRHGHHQCGTPTSGSSGE